MNTSEILESILYANYIEHSKSLKIAADENLKLYNSIYDLPLTEERRLKALGLYRSSLLLYSISVELILKARGLYYEIPNILNSNINSYREFMLKWSKNRNGHNYEKLIEYYKIKLTPKEKELVKNLQSYSVWDGRFPIPTREVKVFQIERGNKDIGLLSLEYMQEIEDFIQNQIKEMK